MGFLKTQFQSQGLHIVGLQETCSSGQSTRHNRDWWVFPSGCSEHGTHGVEVWFSKTLPYGLDGSKKLLFQSQDFTVMACHCRFLLLEVVAPALQCHVLCLHGPYAQSAAMEPSQFWTLIERALDDRSNQHWPLLVLGGFNARLGSVHTSAVSHHQAETETEVGSLMHKFMLGYNLCAPSTFASCHSTAGPAWKVDSSQAARIDYVLIPIQWLPCVVNSAVHLEVDLLTENDHQLVSLELALRLRSAMPASPKQPRPCMLKLSDPVLAHQFLLEVAALDDIPWTYGVGQHCELLTARLQALSKKFFRAEASKPLQTFFSPDTWNLVTIRHTLLKNIRRLDAFQLKLTKQLHFQAWQDRFRDLRTFSGPMSADAIVQLQQLRSGAMLLKLDMICLRKHLHKPARQSSAQDRVHELRSIALRFANSASLADTKQVHRTLKPLLGPYGRKAVLAAKPLPAISKPDGTLAQGRQELAGVWQQHFANIEGGVSIEPSQLQAQLLTSAASTAATLGNMPLDLAPGPGPDNLPAAIYKLDPTLFAQLLYPLCLKIGIRCQEPLKFRGGEIIALAKKATSRFRCTDFRAIVLADQMGKYFHTMQRHKLLPAFASYKAPTQADRASRCKRSFVVLFVDVASAYYKAIRPFIINGDCSDEAVCHMFAQNQWSPDLLQDFLAAMQAPSAFAQAGVSPHMRCQTQFGLQATWFSLRNMPGTLTKTSHGTRPGNPLADLLFAFLFSRVNKLIQEQMDFEGCLDHRFVTQWLPGVPLSPDEQIPCFPGLGSWADDLYLASTVPTADELLPTARTLSRIAIDAAATYGLVLNLGEDKTNLLLVSRGHGSFALRRLLASQSCPQLSVTTKSLGIVQVRIVKDYIHVGSLFDGTSCQPEIHRRFLLASPLVKQLRRPVFGAPVLSLSLKSMLLQSYVLSRFLFGCSTWHFTKRQEYQLWFAKLVQFYSVLLPRSLKGPGFHSLDLLAHTCQVHPALLLAKHRLALLSRMFDPALDTNWSILQASNTWCDQVLNDMQWVAHWVPEFPGWDFQSTMYAALDSFVSSPKTLTTLTRLAEKRCQGYLKLWRGLQSFRTSFRQMAKESKVDWTEPDTTADAVPLTHQCTLCNQHFATFHGLTSHLHKWHGVKNLARRYTSGNVCRHCLTMYDNRENVIQHLKRLQAGCLISLVQTVVPLSLEAVTELDQTFAETRRAAKRQMRNKRFRYPPQRCHGPLRPPLWRRIPTDALPAGLDLSPDAILLWVHDCWHQLQSLDFDNFRAALTSQPCTALTLRSLVSFVEWNLQQLDPDPRIVLALQLGDALSEWTSPVASMDFSPLPVLSLRSCLRALDWRLLRDIRVPNNTGMVGPNKPANEWLQTLSEPFDVTAHMHRQHQKDSTMRLCWPTIPKPVPRYTTVLLYLFSGRRCKDDFMSYALAFGAQHGLTVEVLLVDLALSDHHDLLDEEKYSRLIRWIKSGEVMGVLVAPPCETWSKARGRALDNGANGPRILRDSSMPWALPGCTTAELNQLDIANRLMFVALQVALQCLLSGVMFCMEHPSMPAEVSLASVWRTWPVLWLLQHPTAKLHKIRQSDFGALYVKPTFLMTIWMPHFAPDLMARCAPTNPAALLVLEGRDQDGFRTRWAKEYPPRSNRGLAWAFLTEAQRQWMQQRPQEEISAAFHDFIVSLNDVQQPNEEQAMQPDYSRKHRT